MGRFEGLLVAGSVQIVQHTVDELGSLHSDCVVLDLTSVTHWDTVGQKVVKGLWCYLKGREIGTRKFLPPM